MATILLQKYLCSSHRRKVFDKNLIKNICYIFLIINIYISDNKHVIADTFDLSFIKSPDSRVAPLLDEVLFECYTSLQTDRLKWRFQPVQQYSNAIAANDDDFNNYHQSNNYIYLNNSVDYSISTDGFNNMSRLRLNVTETTIGSYQCIAWFGASSLVSIPAKLQLATISLDEDPSKYNGGIIRNNQPTHWRVSLGNSVLIKCGDVRSIPSPASWLFYKDNIEIPITVPQLSSGTLILESITQKDSGTYSCTGVNAITGIHIQIPQKITLDVLSEYNSEKISPYFLVEPPKEYIVELGTTVLLECPGIGNPIPKAVWSRPDGKLLLTRSHILKYGLEINNVTTKDNGLYVCRLDNGIVPVLVHKIKLNILEMPRILIGPEKTLTNESDTKLVINCVAEGYPKPYIYWMLNGNNTQFDVDLEHKDSKLIFKSVEKRHAGFIQCFAKNTAGEVSSNNILQVNPKSIFGDIGTEILGTIPRASKTKNDRSRGRPSNRKKNKTTSVVLTPPTMPSVTRLSDDKVMVRWSMPQQRQQPRPPGHKKIEISFFKIQYRKHMPKKKQEPWKTESADIPSNVRLYEVNALEAGQYYRFRVAAVYTNNDSRFSNVSKKFLLQHSTELGPTKSHLASPNLTRVEPIGENSVILHWYLPTKPINHIDGFYAYYRPATSAGEYFKQTVDGMNTKQFKIGNLIAGTAYEFKLQSFTSSAASDFSSIITGKTLSTSTTTPTVNLNTSDNEYSNDIEQGNIPIIAGIGGGIVSIILIFVCCCICMKKMRNSKRGNTNEANGFPGGGGVNNNNNNNNSNINNNNNNGHVLGSPSLKNNRLNGAVQRMNITSNPLAQDGGNNDKQLHHHHHHHHHLHNQQHQPQQQQTRRTLEHNTRNLQYTGGDEGSSTGSPTIDCAVINGSGLDKKSTKIDGSSISTSLSRRPRRGSSSNGGGGVAAGVLMQIPGSPKILRNNIPITKKIELLNNRSPMPIRANNGKRNRLGRTENISSGSLNSIEV